MSYQFDTSVKEFFQLNIDLDTCRPEYQDAAQSVGVGGISSSPLNVLKRTALVTSIAVMGTIPFPADIDLKSNGIEASFVFPSSPELIAADEYSRIRDEIVASGLPMLSDEEIRAEIRERKGVKGNTES